MLDPEPLMVPDCDSACTGDRTRVIIAPPKDDHGAAVARNMTHHFQTLQIQQVHVLDTYLRLVSMPFNGKAIALIIVPV